MRRRDVADKFDFDIDYGDFGVSMGWFDKLRLLAEVGPLLAKLQVAMSDDNPHNQAMALIGAAKWAAGRTDTPIDDEALSHLEAVMRTPEGKEMFKWVVAKIGVISE